MASDDESDLFEDGDARDASEPEADGDGEQDQDDEADDDNADQDMDVEDDSDGDEGSGDGEEEEADDEDVESDGSTGSRDAADDEDDQDDQSMDISSPDRLSNRAAAQSSVSDTGASLSPEEARRAAFYQPIPQSKSYLVEPMAAMPHPVPTHCLAASLCMSHVITGSEDGYLRDYDLFATCNGKTFLTAPQRSHCGMGESSIKAGALRFWCEGMKSTGAEGNALSPIYSMVAQSDALWCLAGNAEGAIGLYTLRHSPGSLACVLQGHQSAVSALALQPDERGVYSAGWDCKAIQWDLDTGQQIRQFHGHTSQVAAIAVRPAASNVVVPDGDANDDREDRSDQDSLFSGPDDDASSPPNTSAFSLALPGSQPAAPPTAGSSSHSSRGIQRLSSHAYADYSPDLLMTAGIDGQVVIWDRRQRDRAGRLEMGDRSLECRTACWSADGNQIYVGRRNHSVEIWDVRQTGSRDSSTPATLKILSNPSGSGKVYCVAAFPDGKHLVCASADNIRLWNVQDAINEARPKALGFKIIAGHHGGAVSQMLIDRQCRFLITASSDRGWDGESTKTVLVHDIKRVD